MVGVFPGKSELLLTYYKVILSVMDLQRLAVFAMDAPVHVTREDLLSFCFPQGMKKQSTVGAMRHTNMA